MLIGCNPSPYLCTEYFLRAKEIIRVNGKRNKKPFWWHWVMLNLPGDRAYKPLRCWVAKWIGIMDKVACNFTTYVDEI
eukprot:11360969-Ditylum_brightwellii.AAC.1